MTVLFPALTAFRSWAGKRKRLLAGVVGVAVKTASACVPGVSLAAEMLGQLAENAVEDMLDPDTRQPLTQEQLAQLNEWMANLSHSYAGLLDRLEQMPIADNGTLVQLTQAVEVAIQGDEDLLREFDACLVEVRKQTLSLGVIERKLDEHFHVQQRLSASLEDIKDLFARSPMMSEWAVFRRARPEAVQAVNEADGHFLAGRKDQGVAVYLALLALARGGRGNAGASTGAGRTEPGRPGQGETPPEAGNPGRSDAGHFVHAGAALDDVRSERGDVAELPRGFRVGRKYRIEAEVGRGGMASVYRAERLAMFEKERTVAIKVPAPALMSDPVTRLRFEQEIDVSRQLSQDRHPHIVRVLDYEIFDDPFTRQELYALVLEFVEGVSLAHFLARRREANNPLKINEVENVMQAVCAALEHAHAQGVYHRDLKPHNVMVAKGPVVKLMDFGIARVLDDSGGGPTRPGQILGTLAYLPPELLGGTGVVDARTDIYMVGTLLLELLTGDPSGDPDSRPDCPPEWVKLIESSTSRMRGNRPASIADFRTRLKQESAPPPEAKPVAPRTPIAPPAPPAQPALPAEITNSIGMKLALIPKGTFRMGSPEGEADRSDDEGPQHAVEITRPFYLGVYPGDARAVRASDGRQPEPLQVGGGREYAAVPRGERVVGRGGGVLHETLVAGRRKEAWTRVPLAE